MSILKHEISVTIKRLDEIGFNDKRLLNKAIEVREHAQAPYSHYKVGAALYGLTPQNKSPDAKDWIHVGCNVERGSYTQTTHAEQNALDTMVVTLGSGAKVTSIAIVAGPHSLMSENLRWCLENPLKEEQLRLDPVTMRDVSVPCGHCLQCIWENCHDDQSVRLLSITRHGLVAITTIGDAFPMCFGPKDLGVDYAK